MAALTDDDRRSFERLARTLAEQGHTEPLDRMAELLGLDEPAREVVRTREGSRGSLEAFVVVRTIPREQAQRLLPAGLRLAPQPLTTPDRHPVVLMFARERLEAWRASTDFHGLTLAVPWVEHADPTVPHRGPFLYRPRQYVDDALPRLIGRRVYGFERSAADIECDARAYRIFAPGSRTMLVEAWFERRGPARPPTSMPGFSAVRAIFDQPTITQALRIVDEDAFHRREPGPLLGCINRYLFDDPSAELTPVRAVVRFKKELLPPAFPRERIVAAALDEHELGAFHIRVPQELSLPTQSIALRFPESPVSRREKVVVLGSGPASCAAAFYLAKTGRYDVTMYTLGFRMGGKCAAGRNPDAGDRIEEHGLHAFLGFYHNALRTVREVYEVAGLPLAKGHGPWSAERLAAGEGPFAGGFLGTNVSGLMGQWPHAPDSPGWRYYDTSVAINAEVPGEIPFGEHGPTGFGRAIKTTLSEAIHRARELKAREAGEAPAPGGVAVERAGFLERTFRHIAVRFGDDGEGDDDEHDLVDLLESACHGLERLALGELVDAIERGSAMMRAVTRMLVRLRDKARAEYADTVRSSADKWFEWCGLEMMLTIAIGLLRDRAVHLDRIDRYDLVEWLRMHGISPECERSPMVLFLYDMSFATSSTTPVRPDHLAAGVAIRWYLLLLDYHGFQVYEFLYSCPQSLMTPYYRALRRLGVEIRFFHKVEALQVTRDDEGRRLAGIRLTRQATVKGGPGRYDPLWRPVVPGNPEHLPAWPDRPDYRQLEEGERLAEHDLEDAWTRWPGVGTVELRQGVDFDLCVCGMSLGALPAVVRDLTDPGRPTFCKPWARMIEGLTLCQTVSMQLWMERSEEELYGPSGPVGMPSTTGLLTQFAAPESSFGNFTHLLQWEDWANAPGIETPPAYLAYHTGSWESGHPLRDHPFSEHDYPARTQARWRAEARSWLAENYRSLFDRAPDTFEGFCNQLVAPAGVEGEARLEYQYFNVGLQPWDLYVLSHPGTTTLRLGQSESWVRGLFLCGDWTLNDINAGCVEAATQSGMLAARVISNHPRYVWRPGF